MVLKFGGLLELAEKSTVSASHNLSRNVDLLVSQIVGDLGKLILEEIPLESTQPGLGRPFYTGV